MNELWAVYNTDLNTWIETYENETLKYYHTKQDVDSIFEEYEKDKDKDIRSLIVFNINYLIQNFTFRTDKEAGL